MRPPTPNEFRDQALTKTTPPNIGVNLEVADDTCLMRDLQIATSGALDIRPHANPNPAGNLPVAPARQEPGITTISQISSVRRKRDPQFAVSCTSELVDANPVDRDRFTRLAWVSPHVAWLGG